MKRYFSTGLFLLSVSYFGLCQNIGNSDTLKDNSSWFSKSLEFKGIAVQDDDWQIWGCSPIIGPEGKTHLFVARWPEVTGHQGWYTDSQIAHYVGETPEGPFEFLDIVLEGTGKNTWDKFAPHNPTIHKVGNTYALFYIANTGKEQRPRNQKIGLATSKSLYGPWKKVGTDGLILAPPADSSYYNYGTTNGVVNPAFFQHPDGRFFLYFKSNDMRKKDHWKPMMGMAIADKLEGPYKQLPKPVTNNNSIIEDGYAFSYGDKIYLVTTDNHGMIENGGGLIWESEDGMNFSNPKQAFKPLAHYFEGTLPEQAHLTKGERGSKFERPQILLIDGKPSYLYGPSGTNTDGGKGSAGYVLKIREEFLQVAEKSSDKFEPTWESLKKVKEDPEWLKDAKFGIYTHWGPSTYPISLCEEVAGWYPFRMYDRTHYAFEFHKKTFGDQNKVGYKDLIPIFKAENFDANEWAKIFKRSGAKFAGPVAVHHDNFCLWDSKATKWNSVNMGPKRDITGELAKAVREQDMKFFVSMHHSYSWVYYQTAYEFDAKDSQYSDLYCEPHTSNEKPTRKYLDVWFQKIKEVTDKYAPDILYFDWWMGEMPEEDKLKMVAYTYNQAADREQDFTIVYKRTNLPVGAGLLDYEVHYPMTEQNHFWLTDLSVTGWFPHKNSKYESTNTLIDRLVDIVSKNGAMVLNVPPDHTGRIPAHAEKMLNEMGDWLAINGEAIYNTRPWTIYGYGPYEKMDLNEATKAGWHEDLSSPFTYEDVRFTRSKDGKTVFAIFLDMPPKNKVIISQLDTILGNIQSVSLVGYDQTIKWKQKANEIIFPYPKKAKFENAFVVKIKMK